MRPKTLFLLTATPINNRLADFRHMAELFTRRDEAYFARTLGVNNLRAHFNNMEKALRNTVGHEVADVSGHLAEVQDFLSSDQDFPEISLCNAAEHTHAKAKCAKGKSCLIPRTRPPQVAGYSIRKTYGRLLDMFENAFTRKNPLFTLPMYYPLTWYKGSDKSIDPFEENRQKQVVGLIRTNFLKRFESSVAAFELSCDRLLQKLLAFLEVHSETATEKKRLELWKADNAETLGYARKRQLEFWGEDGDESEDEDIVPQEMLDDVDRLDRGEYDVAAMIAETFRDLDQIVHFLVEARKFEPKHDDKLQKLVRLLKSKELAGQKVLIFTEFADTARYLKRQLDQGRHRRRCPVGQRHQGQSGRHHPALLALLQRDLLGRARPEGPPGDPHPDLHRRSVGRPQPPGRLADDQLRYPLEPGAPDAAHRPRRPTDEPGGRGALRR